MSGELKLREYGKFTKGTLVREFGFNSDQSIDVAGSTPVSKIQSLTTTLEALDFEDAGTTGITWIYNRASVAVEMTVGSGDEPFQTIPAGGSTRFHRINTTYKAKTSSSTGNIEIVALPA